MKRENVLIQISEEEQATVKVKGRFNALQNQILNDVPKIIGKDANPGRTKT
jgi:hypothetical protein